MVKIGQKLVNVFFECPLSMNVCIVNMWPKKGVKHDKKFQGYQEGLTKREFPEARRYQ